MSEDVFISYSRKDFEIVASLKKEMEQQTGVSCWMDLTGIESGDQFRDVIIRAIEETKIVLFMISDNSMNSEFTKKEILYAKNTGKRIVPVMLNGLSPTGWFLFEFGDIDCININNSTQKNKLFRDIKKWTGKTPVSQSFVQQKTAQSAKPNQNRREKRTVGISKTEFVLDTLQLDEKVKNSNPSRTYQTSPNEPITEKLYRQYRKGKYHDSKYRIWGRTIGIIAIVFVILLIISLFGEIWPLLWISVAGTFGFFFFFIPHYLTLGLADYEIDPVTLNRLKQMENVRKEESRWYADEIIVNTFGTIAYIAIIIIVGLIAFK